MLYRSHIPTAFALTVFLLFFFSSSHCLCLKRSTYVSRADARDPYRSIIELSTTPGDGAGASYAAARSEHLRDANVDSLCVGWYVSAHLGAWVTETTLQAQFEHQQECPGAVVIVYDPPRSTQGSLSIQAYRLS